MEEAKRWTVTYTKHIHQKRKVYQDGSLVLNSLRNKIVLYDDSDQLIGGRFLRKGEVIESGNATTLESYLVDIGEPQGENKHLMDGNVNVREAKLNQKCMTKSQNSLHRPSRAGKNTILHKISPNVDLQKKMQISMREWNALYTTQLTQKAKKYHDGILQIAGSGQHMNQVFLHDEDGNVLASKYLKSSECVKSGISCQLPGYLVQICEPKNGLKEESMKDSLVGIVAVANRSSLPRKNPNSSSSVRNKNLHDVILKKSNLSEEIKTSCSTDVKKDLTSAEIIRKMPPSNAKQEDLKKGNFLEDVVGPDRNSQFSKMIPNSNEKLKENVFLEDFRSMRSNLHDREVLCTGEAPTDRPLRDVFQILSKLKKASPGGHINSEKVEVSIPKVSHISHHQEETLAYDAIRNVNHGDDVLTKTNVSQEMMAMDISLVTPIPILRSLKMPEANLDSNSGRTCEFGFEMSESYFLSKNSQVNIPIESEIVNVECYENGLSCGTTTSKTQETHTENSSSFIFLEEKLTFPYEQDISIGDRGVEDSLVLLNSAKDEITDKADIDTSTISKEHCRTSDKKTEVQDFPSFDLGI